ncbi:MAG: ribonuclease H-like domain-containing protein [Armatimonadota bacterium]
MLKSTFIHVPGIGYATERKIWEMGAGNWEQYLECHNDLNLSTGKKSLIRPIVEQSIMELERGNDLYFAEMLPSKDHWRALEHFGGQGEIAYLDIETTGCNYDDAITVIGYYDGIEMKSFVKGINMDDFPSAVSNARMLITFFGSGFDIPFLRRRFPQLKLNQLHVDLCYLFRRIGHTGGLKHIEGTFGICRTPETDGLGGMDAVYMWDQYIRGDKDALDLLLLYNKEDVMNMETLLTLGCAEMKKYFLFSGNK